ncbi:hypothetical protein [Hymenobacter sp. IS2118]|uniref:hypothetical protein n=1 Tax=Hymenobacter sp. IS2118 TaxID=1505605 RepID=UPI0005586C9E|nr:hypothetical protein [Hymenobacter sp. IS2118]
MKIISLVLLISSLLFLQANAQNVKVTRAAIDKTKKLLKAENKTMYSDQVEEMWLECASTELLNWYSTANPNEKKAFEAANGEHPIINQKKKACLKSVLNTRLVAAA